MFEPDNSNQPNTFGDKLGDYAKVQKEKFKKEKLDSFFKKIVEFDRNLEELRYNFHKDCLGARDYLKNIELLKKNLEDIQADAIALVKVKFFSEDFYLDIFSKCSDLLSNLSSNPTISPKEGYDKYVVPLVDTFWNFKHKVEQYISSFSNSNSNLQATKPSASNNVPSFDVEAASKRIDEVKVKLKEYENKKSTTKPLQHVLLQKFKAENDTKLPSIDQAFRRAAAFGTPEDLDALLQLDADINSQDEKKKRTALHNAVIYNKPENVLFLLQKFAKQHLKDTENKSASAYVDAAKDLAIRGALYDESPLVSQNPDLMGVIVSFLPVDDLYSVKRVSHVWEQAVNRRISQLLTKNGLKQEDVNLFYELPKYLQYIITKFMLENDNSEKIRLLFDMLKLPLSERFKGLPITYQQTSKRRNIIYSDKPIDRKNKQPQSLLSRSSFYVDSFAEGTVVSDAGMTLYLLGILTLEQLQSRETQLCTKFAALALVKGLLSYEDISLFKNSGSLDGTTDNLNQLLCKNGIIALTEKLITLEYAPYLHRLDALLSDEGLQALREGLLTLEQATRFNFSRDINNLKLILSKNGLIALRNKYITLEQAVSSSNLAILLSDDCFSLMQDGYLTLEHLKNNDAYKNFMSKLSFISNQYGVLALRKKLLTQKQMEKISCLQGLLTANGIKALEEGVITPEDAAQIQDFESLISPNGVLALKEGLLTIEQAGKFKSLKTLLSNNGLKALREGLLTVNDCLALPSPPFVTNLDFILTDQGISALKERVITVKDGKEYSLAILKIPNAIKALKEGLITLKQASKFKDYGGVFQPRSLTVLLSEQGLQALREHLITPEDAARYYHSGQASGPQDKLDVLLNPIGMQALRKKLIDPSKAADIIELDKLLDPSNPDIIRAMELGIIVPDDFKYGQKLSFWGGNRPYDMRKYTKDAIAERLQKLTATTEKVSAEDKVKATVKIQKCWRRHHAQSKFLLFSQASKMLKTGKVSIHDIHQFNEAVTLIEKGKLQQAKVLVAQLK